MSRVKEWLMADASGSIDMALAEIAQLTERNAELVAALEAVKQLADVSGDYQLSLIAGNAIKRAGGEP